MNILLSEKAKPSSFTPVPRGLLQRKCACGGTPGPTGECETCRKKREAAMLQRAASHAGVVNAVPPIVHEVLGSPGRPLDSATRAFMEPRFGHDFSRVRVHADARAAESARAVNALAYTVGRDVVFGAGQYAPTTNQGRRLMVHELTHVVQQSSALKSQAAEPILRRDAAIEMFEDEAMANAERIGANVRHFQAIHTSPLAIQRVGSGLAPNTPRTDPDIEKQRLDAIQMIQNKCLKIRFAAMQYGVAWTAIAGAILWEALENPYHRSFSRLGPGKVHPSEVFGKSEAEKVEEEKRVTPPAASTSEREQRLQQVDWAITYIAAIMQRHADNYKKIAGVDITNNPGVLCTLYQGGKSEERAQKLAERRKKDPNAQPIAADEMGPWVVKNMDFIRQICTLSEDIEPKIPSGVA